MADPEFVAIFAEPTERRETHIRRRGFTRMGGEPLT